MIRKFFDTATAEPATQLQQPNIAALMAKQGVKSEGEGLVSQPISINPSEKKEEPTPVKETPPVETTNVASDAEKVASEPPKPTEEPVKVEAKKEPEPVKVPSWQEVLRQQQPDTVLKELLGLSDKEVGILNEVKGFDKVDYFTNFLKAWKDGKANDYLRELVTDYSKMSAEEVMRHQLKQEYPKASDKQLEILYRNKIVNAYHLDSEDETEQTEGKLLLEAEADKYRDSFTKNQQSYLMPTPPPPQASEPDNSEQIRQQELEAYKSSILENPYAKDVFSNGKISIGEGDEKFTYKVDANDIQGILFDTDKWAENFFIKEEAPNGTVRYVPDVEKQLFVSTYLKYGKDFLNEYAKHLMSLGGEKALKPIKNASEPDKNTPSPADAAPSSVAEAMARSGRVNYGGR